MGVVTPKWNRLNDEWLEELGYETQCITCKHYQDNGECPAFSTGIPQEILTDEWVHDKLHPLQTDSTILWEPLGE